jgi:hypothetical protein
MDDMVSRIKAQVSFEHHMCKLLVFVTVELAYANLYIPCQPIVEQVPLLSGLLQLSELCQT